MRMISHDALTVSARVYRDLIKAGALFGIGHDAQGRALISELAATAASELPVIDGILAAQKKAAQALDTTQWSPWGQIPDGRKAAEHLNPANDHASAPEKPGETIA